MLVLLDLDNTLVYVSPVWLDRSPHSSFRLGGEVFHIYPRPWLYEFLKRVRAIHRVGIWTAASRPYAVAVLSAIFGPRWRQSTAIFRHRKHCTLCNGEFIKDLSRIPQTCVLLDDKECHAVYNARLGRRVLTCEEYWGSVHDTGLAHAWRMLRTLPLDTRRTVRV